MIKLSKRQLEEKARYIKKYLGDGNNATLSEVDSNANVSHKSVATLDGELNKDVTVQVNVYIHAQKIKELFGKKYAKRFMQDLKNHVIYSHDCSSIKPYCAAISLVPFIYNGASNLAGDSMAPKHLASYCGSYVNLMYSLAGGFSGALCDVSMLTYFHYFAKKDYGADYLKTNTTEIENFFQQLVYSLNSPAGARNHQSIFYNTSIFDKDYFYSMFGEAEYPDGSKPIYEEVNELQKFFMNWFGEERHKALLTFPVLTSSYLTKDGKPKDPTFVDFLAEQMAKGHSFFHYHSDSPSALSSCCFDGSQKVLTKSSSGVFYSSFEELHHAKWGDAKRNLTIFHNGSWVKGKVIKVKANSMYKVTTTNKKTLLVTADHTHPVYGGEKTTNMLSTQDYLLCNASPLDTFPEKDLGLTYEQGYLLGMYLGDGSIYERTDCNSSAVMLSLNKEKYNASKDIIQKAIDQLCIDANIVLSTEYNNVYPVTICSKELVSFIKTWMKGSYCYEKELNLDLLLQSRSFRQGILEGYYLTDGGNSNRIYTTSPKMAEHLEVLITSLGLHSIIDITDRIDEPVIIRGETFQRNYPLYCIRWYNIGNKRGVQDIYKVRNNSIYFRVASIEPLDTIGNCDVYCFEMDNQEEPYFTLPNGIITHNCRLKNEIEINPFAYSLGGSGQITGSIKVITLNINRIIQKKINLVEKVQDVHKYLYAYRVLMEDMKKAHLLPAYDEGYIALEKQYVTVGINGVVEAAEYLGYEITPNDAYLDWVKSIFGTISTENKKSAKLYTDKLGKKVMINTEMVPAENLGVKFAKWDKQDGLFVPRDCYNSYLYKVEDTTLDLIDKLTMHGGDIMEHLDGGAASHISLSEIPDKGTWLKIIQKAIDAGTPYWTSNVLSTCCNSCGYIDMNTRDTCTKCGSKDVDYATRIIGYLKKIKSFAYARQVEANKRFYHKGLDITKKV